MKPLESAQDEHCAGAPGADGRAGTPAGYLVCLLGGLLGTLAAFYLLLFALRATGNLPPPAFSNSLCADEKLSFLREHPPVAPDLLVVGSSVAWRHFDGAAVADESRGLRPLNGAFCGLRANQSAYVANWLLDRQPSVRQVLMIVAPQDFAQCRNTRDAIFDRDDADRFVFGGASPWGYYMRYFSPASLLRNASSVKDQRANRIELDPLVFDRFADGPLDTTSSRALTYGRPDALDPACFDALQALAVRLQREGRSFLVVSSPLHPDWKTQEDPDGAFLAAFDRRIIEALKTTNAQYWDVDGEWTTARASFTDAIHLRWSAAQEFSAVLAQRLRLPGSVATAELKDAAR